MSSKKLVSGLIYLLVIPLVCFGGIMFFRERFYSFVTAALAILTVAGYFLHFEKKHSDSTQLVIIAAMTALSVFGRIVFSFLPGFKPCTRNRYHNRPLYGKRIGLYDRRNDCSYLKLLFRTGCVDAFSNAGLGSDRIFCRNVG